MAGRLALALIAAALAGGCSRDGDVADPPTVRSIDEVAGTYRGVGLGDAASAAIHRFGEPQEIDGPATPVGVDWEDGGPLFLRNPDGYIDPPNQLRYRDVALLATPRGIHAVIVADPAAATARGVAIGDPLDDAARAYPSLRCSRESDAGEHGTDPPRCHGRIAPNRYIWFGNDPIQVIALSPTPMG